MTEQGADFITRVLRAFSAADATDTLFWKADGPDGVLTFYAMCSDTFDWATADGEEITPDNVDQLEQALKDVRAACSHSDWWMAVLFAARVRGRRPLPAAYPDDPALIALLDACGPEREGKA